MEAGAPGVILVRLPPASRRRSPRSHEPPTPLERAYAQTRAASTVQVPFIISVYRRCISSGVTSSIELPMFHSWPNGSRTVPDRSP